MKQIIIFTILVANFAFAGEKDKWVGNQYAWGNTQFTGAARAQYFSGMALYSFADKIAPGKDNKLQKFAFVAAVAGTKEVIDSFHSKGTFTDVLFSMLGAVTADAAITIINDQKQKRSLKVVPGKLALVYSF